MKVIIGADHNGFNAKKEIIEYLQNLNYEVIDEGCNSAESGDYPIYAKKVCESVLNNELSLGILICGTGIGMSIAANKINHIYCAKIDNKDEARLCREHNNANVIALSAKKDMEELKEEILIFLKTPFSNEERHIRRLNIIDNL